MYLGSSLICILFPQKYKVKMTQVSDANYLKANQKASWRKHNIVLLHGKHIVMETIIEKG